jgi:hypothetical protein
MRGSRCLSVGTKGFKSSLAICKQLTISYLLLKESSKVFQLEGLRIDFRAAQRYMQNLCLETLLPIPYTELNALHVCSLAFSRNAEVEWI